SATVHSLRRQSPFDVAVLFPNSLRVALEAWLSGIPRRVGYRGHFRAWLLNQIVHEPKKNRPPEHQAVHYLRIAEQLGAEVQLDEPLGSKTSHAQRPTRLRNATARQALNAQLPSAQRSAAINHQPVIGLSPG